MENLPRIGPGGHRPRPAPPQAQPPKWFRVFLGTILAAVFCLLCVLIVLILLLGIRELWHLL